MNFLAHAYLSGNDEQLLIGNFIADGVKGKDHSKFSQGVIDGIELHHKIDLYTDTHPVVRQSKDRLKDKYGKYSAVLVDIFYDHFLAVNWKDYSNISLKEYADFVYEVMQKNSSHMPARVQNFLPYMISQNWLLNYAQLDGIHQTLQGMSRRSSFDSKMEEALDDLKADYPFFEEDFKKFFPLLINYVKSLGHTL